MKRSIPSGFFGLGAALFLAGCVNLAGANISGNSLDANVKTGDINAGNGNNLGNNNGNNNGGVIVTPGVDYGPVVRVELNRDAYRLRRLPPNTDLNNLQFDFSRMAFISNNNYYNPNPTPSPDSQLDLGGSEDYLVTARAIHEKGQSFDIGRDSFNNGDWMLELPPGIEAKRDYAFTGPFNGQPPLLLIARSEAATGSFEIRLVNQRDASCPVATASLEVVDQGSVDVSF